MKNIKIKQAGPSLKVECNYKTVADAIKNPNFGARTLAHFITFNNMFQFLDLAYNETVTKISFGLTIDDAAGEVTGKKNKFFNLPRSCKI